MAWAGKVSPAAGAKIGRHDYLHARLILSVLQSARFSAKLYRAHAARPWF